MAKAPERPSAEVVADLVRILAINLNLKRDNAGDWWGDDWGLAIPLEGDVLALLNEIIPEGRVE